MLFSAAGLRDLIQHAVYEGGGIGSAVPFADLNSLVQGYVQRNVRAKNHLIAGQAQNNEIDLGQAHEFPVFGTTLDHAVDLYLLAHHTGYQPAGEFLRPGIAFEVAKKMVYRRSGGVARHLDLVKRLQGQFTALASVPGASARRVMGFVIL